MLFKAVTVDGARSLTPVEDAAFKELELEKYLIDSADGSQKLQYTVFKEDLLLISNQVRTRQGKRADILALDRSGNAVIIELKRDAARLGVDTQALQYLANYSALRGEAFIKYAIEKHKERDGDKETEKDKAEIIREFVRERGVRDEDINRRSRIILMARGFDETLFSMGEWLSGKGVDFRCIRYAPYQIEGQRYLSFSVEFDRSSQSLYGLSQAENLRGSRIFWHNIAGAEQLWWSFLIKQEQLPACFSNSKGDRGSQIMESYKAGDEVIAFAKGRGAVGYGVIADGPDYKIVQKGSLDDLAGDGRCLHRITVKWKSYADRLEDAEPVADIYKMYGIYHPFSTRVGIDQEKGRRLIDALRAKPGWTHRP